MTHIYYIEHADTCELAHQLTYRDCLYKGIEIEKIDENGELIYPDEAQYIFDNYVNMIESVMLSHQIKTLKEFNQNK